MAKLTNNNYFWDYGENPSFTNSGRDSNADNDYAWWVGSDGNVWANVNGNVQVVQERGSGGNGNMVSNVGTLWAGNRIADPNAQSSQPQSPGDYNGYGGGSNSSYDKNAVDHWNSAIDVYENKLNGLNGLLDSLNAKTNSEYDTKNNELQSSYNRSKSEYDQSSRQNSQQLQTNKNAITDRASQGLRGLLRTLGAMGAGGSSSALYNAPELVTALANQERAGANQTFGENQQKLDTNWGNFKLDWDNDKKKLEDWKQGQYRQNEQNVLSERNNILGSLMDAYTQRGAAGQSAGSKLSELSGQMKANDNRLNELNRFVKPSYDGTRATYTAPSLSSYNTGASSITTEVSDAPENGFSAKTSPSLAMLLGVKNRKNSNPYGRE